MTKKEYNAALAELEAGRIVRHNGRTAATKEQLDFLAAAKDAEPLALTVTLADDALDTLKAATDTGSNDGKATGYEPPDLPDNPPIGSADSRTAPTVNEKGEDTTPQTGTEVGDADVKVLTDDKGK